MTNPHQETFRGVWSAAPTPFTSRMAIDTQSVNRMVEHHIRLGVKGLFLAGTNGEGPWMTNEQRRLLIRTAVRCNKGRLALAMQVTDNSAARILDNIRMAREDGADIAVIAPPHFMVNISTSTVLSLYLEAIRKSPLPIGIYDRMGAVNIPPEALKLIYNEKKVVVIKDSSMSDSRMKIALAAKRERPALMLMSGYEFDCVKYLESGYDGLLLGGGVFNGYLAGTIMAAVEEGDIPRARRLQNKMNRIMCAVYGGKRVRCWLAGEKELLVAMGIFRTTKNYPNYEVSLTCRSAIKRVLKNDAAVLRP